MSQQEKVRDNAGSIVFPTGEYNYGGLTKRELFAAMVMAAVRGNPSAYGVCNDSARVAAIAVRHADALLEALAKKEEGK